MTTGKIHSIESMGLVDGPGIRTVLFFQGCKLRCRYCHNPDTWNLQGGREMTVQELIKLLKRYEPYYGEEGGVTCSGGEPLLQADFLTELFKACKQEGISTCLDTAGYGNGSYEELLSYTDLVILDIKHDQKDAYHDLTGGDIAVPTAFLEAVKEQEVPLWIRHVVVPNLTDSEEHIKGLGALIRTIPHVKRVELLPYHVLGVEKYEKLGLPYSLQDIPPMNRERTEQLQKLISEIVFA